MSKRKLKQELKVNIPEMIGSNKKMFLHSKDDEYRMPILRIWHRKARKKKAPSMLIKCGCCDSKFEIYYFALPRNGFSNIEINGVIASVSEWRKVLMPLIGLTVKFSDTQNDKK